MSYHILHLNTPNCTISVENGLLFCKYKNDDINIIAISDIKAIIVATFGVSFTNSALSKLLKNNVVILHCDNKFQPVGWSCGLDRIVKTKVFYNQISQNETFENELWKTIVKRKMLNQAQCLDLIGLDNIKLLKLINKPLANEANVARQYWQNYFSIFDENLIREHKNAQSFENSCLNYGYAIFKTLILRSVLIHGLTPSLGVHHEGKYKSTPLIYDLIEPFRPFVDYYFYLFTKKQKEDYEFENHKEWVKFLSSAIKNYRIKINNVSFKIVDSIEIYVEKIAKSYKKFDCKDIFMPELKLQYLHIDKQNNREYEE